MSRFVPARDASHRTAALALLRALLRTGRRVPLGKQEFARGYKHPVTFVISERIRNNMALTSRRLIYSAMVTGYQVILKAYSIAGVC